jgi:hypothetical protein
MEKLKIVKKTVRPFNNSKGEKIDYAWYKAVREKDGVTIEFGSSDCALSVDQSYELLLEKTELSGGKFRYKQVKIS